MSVAPVNVRGVTSVATLLISYFLAFREGFSRFLLVASVAELLEHGRFALIKEPDLVEKLKFEGLLEKAAGRFMQWFVAEAECSKMHRNHHLGTKLAKRLESLLGVHVDVPFCRCLVSANGKQCEFNVGTFPDLLKSLKVCGVAAVEYGASGVFDEKPSESSVAVMENSSTPVTRRSKGDLQGAMFKTLPTTQLVDFIESQAVDEVADMFGYGYGLVAGYRAQGAAVQVIEVRMCDQHEIDGREIVKFDSRVLDPLDDFKPLRPVGVYEHTVLGCLNEKRCVSDPRHTELSRGKIGEHGLDPVTVTSGKERGDDDLCKKVSLVPPVAQPHVHVILRLCALSSSQQRAHHRLGTILE